MAGNGRGRRGGLADDGTPDGYALAHAAAWDVGNASMRAAGRQAWNGDDWNAAAGACARFMGRGPASQEMMTDD